MKCSCTRLDRTRNVVIIDKVGVVPVDDKMRETKLGLFGHVTRRSVNVPVSRCETINIMHCMRGIL